MSVGPEEVRRIARLAQIEVADSEMAALTEQLARIVDFVGQLGAEDDTGGQVGGGGGARLRPDRVAGAGGIDLASFAPEIRDGFFVVPRLPALDAE